MSTKYIQTGLSILTGLEIFKSESQGHTNFRYGYALISLDTDTIRVFERQLDKSPWKQDPSIVEAQARGEGDEGKYPNLGRTYTIDFDFPNWYDKFLEWGAEVLSTGRTLECGKGMGLKALQEGVIRGCQTCDVGLNHIENLFHPESERRFDLNLDSPYQRDHVWTKEQSSSFVGYMLQTGGSGAPLVPLIFIQRDQNYQEPDEVIDGKQRLLAMHAWVHNKIPATVDGVEYWYKDATAIERRCLPNIKVGYVNLTEKQRLQFYILLNAGGTPHTVSEISKVRTMLDKLTETDGLFKD
jgi:hypothetical protein